METELIKYPHTSYLPWSSSIDANDKIVDPRNFYYKEIVVTEKMDGENITMYCDYIHARSLTDDGHVSKDWIKNYWGQIRHLIPEGVRICGECLYVKHSIYYDDLPSYFLGFSAWYGLQCWNWDDTLTLFKDCGIISVPVIYRGVYDENFLTDYAIKMDFEKHEGYVVRFAGNIDLSVFEWYVAKFVRPQHVQTNAVHWKYTTLTRNKLA